MPRHRPSLCAIGTDGQLLPVGCVEHAGTQRAVTCGVTYGGRGAAACSSSPRRAADAILAPVRGSAMCGWRRLLRLVEKLLLEEGHLRFEAFELRLLVFELRLEVFELTRGWRRRPNRRGGHAAAAEAMSMVARA